MIYGKTFEQRKTDAETYIKEQAKWRYKFVWFPVQLKCGRWAFLETVLFRRLHYSYLDMYCLNPWENEYVDLTHPRVNEMEG